MLKKMFLRFLFAVLVSDLLIAGINFKVTKAGHYSSSSTYVGGIIWENTTWTLENSPYIITEIVQIPENVTLTIEPGVTVIRPTPGDMFLLHGRIEAHGTVVNKIIFDGGGNSNFFSPKKSVATTFLNLSYSVIRNGLSLWPPTGYSQYGSFSIKYCELINLASYSYVWYPERDVHMEFNTFINSAGFSVGHSGPSVYIRYNLIKGNKGFVAENWASYAGQTIVKYNSFIDMSGIVLELPPGYDSAAMTATENYWGTNNTDIIDSMIYDKKDDITCAGFIEYLPILTEPHPNTPTLPLIVNFTYSPSIPHAHGTVTFDASASFGPYSTIANYTWDFGDGNNITLNTPIATHTYTMPDNYNVTLIVTDEFGFKNSTTTSLMVFQDDASPITTDDYDGLWHNTDFTITLIATDLESGVAETYYRINDGPVKVVSTDGQPFIATEGANNKLEYWSIDNAGNEELPHKILTGIKLDKTAPAIEIPSRIPENDVEPDQEVKVSVNVTDLVSEVKNATLCYTNDTVWYSAPMAFNTTSALWEAIIPGHTEATQVKYRIEAYDNAGNMAVEDNAGQYYTYTVIPEFPSTFILTVVIALSIFIVALKKRFKPFNNLKSKG